MLATLFYTLGLFLFLMNFLLLTKVSKYVYLKEFITSFQKVTQKKPEKKDFSGDDYEFFNFIVLNNFFTFLWFFFGLISQNWLVFLFYFLVNGLLTIFYKYLKVSNLKSLIELLRLTFNVILILLLVMNHFHLHLNLTNLILR